jgi:hypothetical protein
LIDKTENKANDAAATNSNTGAQGQGTTNATNMEGAKPVDQGRNSLNFKGKDQSTGQNAAKSQRDSGTKHTGNSRGKDQNHPTYNIKHESYVSPE